jgi:hypothetical protein
MDATQTEDCVELKNIKYQTMLLNNKTDLTPSINTDIQNIDKFLDDERLANLKKPWSKLSSAIKLKLIKQYIEIYAKENNIIKEHKIKLFNYLRKLLERKKLQRVKDVIYDIENSKIINIPGLIYNKINNKFTIKRTDKTGSSLKNLAPKTLKKKKKRKKAKDDKKKNKIDIKTSD